MNNFLHDLISSELPFIIYLLEIMASIIIFLTAANAFFLYFQSAIMHKKIDLQVRLSSGLVTGLEFAMAAEILKTILVQTLEEIYILGGIIILRIVLSLLIHFENNPGAFGLGKKNGVNNPATTVQPTATCVAPTAQPAPTPAQSPAPSTEEKQG